MLTLVNIEPVVSNRESYRVTLDRDGGKLTYDFEVERLGAGRIGGIGPPERTYYDLIDYEVESPGSISHGVITIPALRVVCRAVGRFSRGEVVELPLLLDER